MTLELTKDQCVSLIDYIEVNLFDVIRNDTDIDSIIWVRNILDAHRIFEEAVKSDENA